MSQVHPEKTGPQRSRRFCLRHVLQEEEAAWNRQFAAAARSLETVKWAAKKRGVRVHVIDPWMTTRRCFFCRPDNPARIDESFICEGCGKRLEADENAARHLARLVQGVLARWQVGPVCWTYRQARRRSASGKRKKPSRSQEGTQDVAAD